MRTCTDGNTDAGGRHQTFFLFLVYKMQDFHWGKGSNPRAQTLQSVWDWETLAWENRLGSVPTPDVYRIWLTSLCNSECYLLYGQ